MSNSRLETPFRDRGGSFSVSADTLDAVYQLLVEADKAGAAAMFLQESKLIISPLVWTENDLEDKLPDGTDLLAAAAVLSDLEDWEHAMEVVNRDLDEAVERHLAGVTA